MKPQYFTFLAVAAAASLGAAMAIYTAEAPWSRVAAGGGKLFPALQNDITKVARIEVRQGTSTVALERSGEQWLFEERGGFPASTDKVRALLEGLAQAELTEPKTRNPDRYKILELEDPLAKDANARLVRLVDDTGAAVAELVVGKQRSDASGAGKGGTYVRKPGDVQTWLINTEIGGGTGLRDWTKSRLFETAPEKITKLRIELPGEQAYDIVRDASGEQKLADMPAGKKLKFANLIDNILDATAVMDFDDVRKAEGTAGGGEAGTTTVETENGLKVTFKVRRDKDAAWITLSAAGEGEAKKQADEISARANGWEFKILPSQADAMLKRHDDLLEDSPS